MAPCLLFDLDQTLVHSPLDLKAVGRELRAVLDQHGVVPPADPALTVGQILLWTRQHDQRAGTGLEPLLWQRVAQREEEALDGASVEDGAPLVLAALKRRGLTLGVWTNNSRAAAGAALARFSLAPWLDLTITRDDMAALKPDPAGLAVARQAVGPQAAIYVVGDSWIDGAAAQRGGAHFIAFCMDDAALARSGAAAWARISTLEELLAFDYT